MQKTETFALHVFCAEVQVGTSIERSSSKPAPLQDGSRSCGNAFPLVHGRRNADHAKAKNQKSLCDPKVGKARQVLSLGGLDAKQKEIRAIPYYTIPYHTIP